MQRLLSLCATLVYIVTHLETNTDHLNKRWIRLLYSTFFLFACRLYVDLFNATTHFIEDKNNFSPTKISTEVCKLLVIKKDFWPFGNVMCKDASR